MKPEGGRTAIWDADEDFALIGEDGEKNYVRLDLACGNNKRKGFIGVDLNPKSQADLIVDLESDEWPWDNNSINEIICSHFVEHLPDLRRFMEHIWKILVPGGVIQIIAPYWTHLGAHQDFSHVRCINEVTFQYFCRPSLRAMNIEHYEVKCDFDVALTRFYFEPEWTDRAEEAKEWARKHYNNVVREIEVHLKAIKPMRI